MLLGHIQPHFSGDYHSCIDVGKVSYRLNARSESLLVVFSELPTVNILGAGASHTGAGASSLSDPSSASEPAAQFISLLEVSIRNF